MTTKQKALAWQALAVIAAGAVVLWFAHNVVDNLAQRSITFGFGFLFTRAGFDIPFHLVAWDESFTYGHALYVAGVNTLFAAALIIILASALGLALALMRLSGNPLAVGTARVLIEVIRNTPQLTQIVFFYLAVLQVLPPMRQSIHVGASIFLNVRGLYVPAPSGTGWDWIVAGTIVIVMIAAVSWRRLGVQVPRLIVLPPVLLLGLVLAGFTAQWDPPALKGFNFVGGVRLPPELVALTLGITVYTSAFIAEIVRAAIMGVHRGQAEAARSLGLSAAQTMFVVILPQALRILIPPLTSQYLNIIKSTTLGAAIAYPEILQVYARTVLNQSGRAIEVMTLVLGVFLAINLLASAAMNAWNRHLTLQGR
ncbi:amino acid ABC transporter permease [Limobrevibacterium gyesilva]|uniref:ABC transporter permease subunit n=1 Tax=Limobrevibacterium gyesilva TaxID=2991712 RepID=A0AA41YT75_9PROT|nr:ABC transporter permease subunit [Limobrevibacterium gyesilva]MCW3476123.1 ABC transporter permease subunit [Limobrevibacterium gyesilva]